MTEHKCKFDSTTCNSERKLTNKTCVNVKIVRAKKIITGILAHVLVRIVSI